MKKILLFLILLFQINIAYNQSVKETYYAPEDYNVTPFIYFVDSNKYVMSVLISFGLDDITSYDISYGIVQLKDNRIILKDRFNDLEIILLQEDNDIMVDKGFVFMYNKNFKYFSETFSSVSETYLLLDSIKNSNNTIKLKHKRSELKYGYYKNKQGFILKIMPDNTYKLEINNITISEGSIEIKDNKIVFYDKYLRHNFIAELEKDTIINANLIGNFNNSRYDFYKKLE